MFYMTFWQISLTHEMRQWVCPLFLFKLNLFLAQTEQKCLLFKVNILNWVSVSVFVEAIFDVGDLSQDTQKELFVGLSWAHLSQNRNAVMAACCAGI